MIEQLEQDYQNFAANSRDIGKGIASSVSMLQLDNVNESVASAVVQIESLTNKSEGGSALAKLPFFGKWVTKAKDSVKEEQLRSGQMIEVVDRLFNSLNTKKDNIVSVMTTLFELKEQLSNEVEIMVSKEAEAIEISNTDTGINALKARNLLVQVQQSIVKAKDRVQIINATVQSAQASTIAISSLLPTLQGELITEMAIQSGLQELKEFKQIFDTTIGVVEELNATNNSTMKTVMLDVVDLAISRPNDIAKLENLNSERVKFKGQLQAKMDNAKKEQEKGLLVLAEVRTGQQSLELKD
jgi:hypothetical protein